MGWNGSTNNDPVVVRIYERDLVGFKNVIKKEILPQTGSVHLCYFFRTAFKSDLHNYVAFGNQQSALGLSLYHACMVKMF